MQTSLPRRPASRGHLARVILAQATAAVALGAALGFTGLTVGRSFFAGAAMGFGDIVAGVAGLMIGYTLGAGLAVWLVGRLMGHLAPAWAPMLAAILGSAATLLAARVGLGGDFYLMWGLFLTLGPIAAVAAHHAAARRP